MLKQSAIKRIILSSVALLIMILVYIFPSPNNSSIPEEVIYVDELTMPIYVMDQNHYIARTTIIKPSSNQVEYIIDCLTIDSLNANYLPNGFTPIIPKQTKLLSHAIDNDLLKINFSKDILNVNKKHEEKMIESLIYSLCEIEGINKIMIFVEDKILDKLPHSGKSLPSVLDKSYGINKIYNFHNFKNTTKTTIYYMSKYNDNLYYIPITKITNSDIEAVEVIVNELKSTPIYETNLISYLNASYELKDYQILEDSITISFNNNLLANLDDKDISEKVRYTLSLSLRDTYNIDNIVINLN